MKTARLANTVYVDRMTKKKRKYQKLNDTR